MEEVKSLEADKKSNKLKLILIISIILVIILILIFGVRAYAENYYINKKSDYLRKTLTETINKGNAQIRHLEVNLTKNITEIKKDLQENRNYLENQINDLETKGTTEILDLDITYLCDGKNINHEPEKLLSCSNKSIIENKGYKEFTVNETFAVRYIAASSSLILLNEYNTYVLEENKYELENKLKGLIGDLEENKQITDEIKGKIKDIKINSGAVIAQILDSLNFLSKEVIMWQTMVSVVRENVTIEKIKEVNNNIALPSEEQINSLKLKEGCINMFKNNTQYSGALETSPTEKILLISASISNICDNLIIYQKQNAIKMLRTAQTEKNPFVSIFDKLYLNLLVNCKDEWFSLERDKPCTSNYLNEFKLKFS
ncbi:hypothetical protein FJZ19_05790 [Candidatus Pacearchaeota archaeon]|nr:hypothetical protein [Candidatus Pacearchaeota archaeon]